MNLIHHLGYLWIIHCGLDDACDCDFDYDCDCGPGVTFWHITKSGVTSWYIVGPSVTFRLEDYCFIWSRLYLLLHISKFYSGLWCTLWCAWQPHSCFKSYWRVCYSHPCLIMFALSYLWDFKLRPTWWFNMTNFDVILGMTLLSTRHNMLACHAKTVTLEIPDRKRLKWEGCKSLSQLKSYHLFGLKKW